MKLFISLVVLVVLSVLQVNAVCRDRLYTCPVMKLYCGYKIFERFLRSNCPFTCGFCSLVSTYAPITLPSVTHPPTEVNTDPPVQSCGKQLIPNSRVIGGTTAVPGSWPWQVLMLFDRNPGCGGSIISPRWIVTAAHCVSGKEDYARYFKIRVGEHNQYLKEGSEEEYSVSKIISHPGWDLDTLDNDIALMKLTSPIRFNSYVQPICLPDDEVKLGTNCYITGWGKTAHPGSMTDVLQQTTLPVVSSSICESYNRKAIPVPITKGMVCGGNGGQTKQSGCHGDSGGPFVCQINNRWELHGAVSHGSPRCSSRDTYTVFARVSYFKNWITKTMQNN